MKKRKTFAFMAIFIAVLVLGVGYATITNVNLNLGGTANVLANAEFSVEYDTEHTVVVSPESATIDWTDGAKPVVAGAYTDSANATMTVYLDTENTTATAIYKIENNSPELKAAVNIKTASNESSDYLTVSEALYADASCNTALGTTEIAPGEAAYLKVTVELTKLPAQDVAGVTFTIGLEAEPKDQA